jgi:hypothetical protein
MQRASSWQVLRVLLARPLLLRLLRKQHTDIYASLTVAPVNLRQETPRQMHTYTPGRIDT